MKPNCHQNTMRRRFLSYRKCSKIENSPPKGELFSMVHSVGFEPATFGSASQRSIQLSYECLVICISTTITSWIEVGKPTQYLILSATSASDSQLSYECLVIHFNCHDSRYPSVDRSRKFTRKVANYPPDNENEHCD